VVATTALSRSDRPGTAVDPVTSGCARAEGQGDWSHVTSVRPAPAIASQRTVSAGVLVAAILLLGLNLRGPIVAVSPVLDVIATDLGIGAATAGLLTSLPVLCFALATPAASVLLARAGLRRGVAISLVVLLAGIVLRSLDGLPCALAGTLLIGIGITVSNVAVPVVIARDLPRRAGGVLGAYTAALNVGSMLTISLTVPLAAHTGWRVAIAAWGVLVLAALALWVYATRRPVARPVHAARESDASGGARWWRRPVVWALTIAFAGQAFSYYGITAWLPLLLHDELGMDAATAGTSASVFQVAALVGAFGVPVLLRMLPGPRPVVMIVAAGWAALPLGLLLAPQLWPVWSALGGAAQGGGLTVIFALVVRKARDLAENRRMSALVQGGGYIVAATGPSVVGAVHEATAGWTAPLLVVLGAITVLAVFGVAAAGGRDPRPT
jgi:CP family cyanate transporter-like MFS transporter